MQPREVQQLRILIVDDEGDGASALQLMLTVWGHSTRLAHTGEQALKLCDTFKPNVVLLEIALRDMHGFEVARRLRKSRGCRECLLVAITRWDQEADRLQGKDAGLDHHLGKPVAPEKLRTLLLGFSPPARPD
jgi:CheY-like chemotaxis protein